MSTSNKGYRLTAASGIHRGDRMYQQDQVEILAHPRVPGCVLSVVADGMVGTRHRSNTELIAQGVANVASPIFGGIPATGAIARTATNVKNGGRTPVAGIVHALVLLVIMLFFAPLAARIPICVLAGILVVVAYNMSEWRVFAPMRGAHRRN